MKWARWGFLLVCFDVSDVSMNWRSLVEALVQTQLLKFLCKYCQQQLRGSRSHSFKALG